MLHLLIQSPWVERTGWVLVHSLWQFALVALLAAVLQRSLRRRSATLRYGVLLAATSIVVALPAVTWFAIGPIERSVRAGVPALAGLPASNRLKAELQRTDFPPIEIRDDLPDSDALSRDGAKPQAAAIPQEPKPHDPVAWWSKLKMRLEPWLPAIVLVWIAGVAIFAFRPLASWYTVRRLRTVGVSPVAASLRDTLDRTAKKLALTRAVTILQSTLIKTPVVIGYFRPLVLLPVCVVTGLPESQLELILAHELAHIRRHDYLVNLLQTLIETLFFYHPAVWWLSRRIRHERENCCDDIALSLTANRADYGRALLAIEELRAAAPALSVAAGGGSLLARIRRIAKRDPAPRASGGMIALLLAVAATAALVTWGAVITPPVNPESDATTLDDPLPDGASLRLGTLRFRHRSFLNCVAFSPDGKTIASSASNNDTDVCLWNAKTGKLQMRIGDPDGRPSAARSLAYSPDGTKLVMGRNDGAVLLTDTRTGRVLFKHLGRDTVTAVAFAPDSSTFASGGEDGLVHVWNASNGAESRAFDTGERPPAFAGGPVARVRPEGVAAIAYSPDGKSLAVGTGSTTIRVWNLSDGRLILSLPKAHGTGLESLVFVSGGKELISGGFRDIPREEFGRPFFAKNVQVVETKVWNPQTGKLVREIKSAELEAGYGKIALSADGNVLASGTKDAIHLWDPASGKSRGVIANPGWWGNYALAITADGAAVASSCGNSVAVWDVESGKQRLMDIKAYVNGLNFAAYSPDGATVLTGGWDGRAIAWNASAGKVVYELPIGSSIHSMTMSADGKFIAAGGPIDWNNLGSRSVVRIWNARTGETVREFGDRKGPYGMIHSLRFSQDGKLLAIASDNHGDNTDEIDVREIANGRKIAAIQTADWHFEVSDMAFSANGANLCVAYMDKVGDWDLKTGKEIRSFVPLPQPRRKGEGQVAGAIFSPDAKRLITSLANAITVWDVATGMPISSVDLPGHRNGRYLGLSPDGRLLAAAEVIYAGPKPGDYGTGGIELCSIAPDGDIRVIADDSGQAERAAKTGDGRVIAFAFSADNKRLITGMDSGTALVWDVPAGAVPADRPAAAKQPETTGQTSSKKPASDDKAIEERAKITKSYSWGYRHRRTFLADGGQFNLVGLLVTNGYWQKSLPLASAQAAAITKLDDLMQEAFDDGALAAADYMDTNPSDYDEYDKRFKKRLYKTVPPAQRMVALGLLTEPQAAFLMYHYLTGGSTGSRLYFLRDENVQELLGLTASQISDLDKVGAEANRREAPLNLWTTDPKEQQSVKLAMEANAKWLDEAAMNVLTPDQREIWSRLTAERHLPATPPDLPAPSAAEAARIKMDAVSPVFRALAEKADDFKLSDKQKKLLDGLKEITREGLFWIARANSKNAGEFVKQAEQVALFGILTEKQAALVARLVPPAASESQQGSNTSDEPANNEAITKSKAPEVLGVKTGVDSGVPVSGTVVDEHDRPVEGAEVRSYQTGWSPRSQRLVQTTQTDAKGEFHLNWSLDTNYRCPVTISKTGFASRIIKANNFHSRPPDDLGHLVLSKLQSIRGRVTDPEGQPIVGADVWTPELVGPLAGVQSAKTDANGYFDISDVEAWKDDGTRPWTKSRPPGRTAPTGTAFRCLRVWRADYGLKIGNYSQVPATVNVSFEKPAIVIGRAFDRAAAKPLSGALVELETALTEVNAAKNVYGHDEAVTDEHGNFRLVIQGGGTCRLWFVRRSADVKVIKLSKSPDRQIEAALGNRLDLGKIEIDFVTTTDAMAPPASSTNKATQSKNQPNVAAKSGELESPPGFLFLPAAYGVLATPEGRRRYGIDAAQEKKLREIADAFKAVNPKSPEAYRESPPLPPQSQTQYFWTQNEAEKQIEGVLTARQRAGYKHDVACDIVLALCSDPEQGAKTLGLELSQPQKQQLKRMGEENDRADDNRVQQTYERLLAVLTAAQREKLMAQYANMDSAGKEIYFPAAAAAVNTVSVNSVDTAGEPAPMPFAFTFCSRGGVSLSVFWQLASPENRQKLQLSAPQQSNLQSILVKSRSAAQQIFDHYEPMEATKKLSPDAEKAKQAEYRQKLESLGTDIVRQIEAALTPQQLLTLRKIVQKQHAISELMQPDGGILKTLEATREQEARIRQFDKEITEPPQDLLRPAAEKALGVLTPQQRKWLGEHVGP